jgi:hypothetical protein
MEIEHLIAWPPTSPTPQDNMREFAQVAQLASFSGHWLGRAHTRRVMAEVYRAEGKTADADHCLRVASAYEAKAEKVVA